MLKKGKQIEHFGKISNSTYIVKSSFFDEKLMKNELFSSFSIWQKLLMRERIDIET